MENKDAQIEAALGFMIPFYRSIGVTNAQAAEFLHELAMCFELEALLDD